MTAISCDCGQAKLNVMGDVLVRIICHCTICQTFNNAPKGDLAIFRAHDVRVMNNSKIDYHRFRKPPAVDRGRCSSCGQPTVEYLNLPLAPKLSFVPTARLTGRMPLPAASMHAFYDSRIAEADDDIPRYEGYWPSQLAMLRHLVPALLS